MERRGDKMLGKADSPSNKGKQEGVKKGDTLGKADTLSNTGKEEGAQWETRGARPSKRRTHHPTRGNKKGYGVQSQRRGDKTLGKADTPSNKGKQERAQWETKGDQTLEKADTPSNRGKQEGVHWGHTIQQRETRKMPLQTSGDKTLRKADTSSNKGKQEGAQWERMGNNGGQGEAKPSGRDGGHTIQHQGGHLKKALRNPNSTLLGEQEGRQDETKGETTGDKTLGKANTPSWKQEGKQEGRQGETRPSGRRTHIHRETKGPKGRQGDTRGGKGRQGETRPSGRRTHHPTKGNKK